MSRVTILAKTVRPFDVTNSINLSVVSLTQHALAIVMRQFFSYPKLELERCKMIINVRLKLFIIFLSLNELEILNEA
jgi:hypothetical protein